MKRLSFFIFVFFAAVFLQKNNGLAMENVGSKTVVSHFGSLRVDGKNIVDKNGDTVVLHGMSLFWSQWGGQFYNKETVDWLVNDWHCTVIRAAIGIAKDGYPDNPEKELEKLYTVIDACVDAGIYVIIDWHDHHAEKHGELAAYFFAKVSAKYSDTPNVIYEIFNEPLKISWKEVIKPYAEKVISVIRKNDPDNLIVVGTPTWSQDVDDVIGNRIDDPNTVYSYHFYSSTHQQDVRDRAIKAMDAGVPLFVTEWGMSEASGTGTINVEQTKVWTDFLEKNNLSWCNWSIITKDETSAALLPTTEKLSGWSDAELSQSGKTIRNYIREMNSDIFKNLK